jgi:hypothetical protein
VLAVLLRPTESLALGVGVEGEEGEEEGEVVNIKAIVIYYSYSTSMTVQ